MIFTGDRLLIGKRAFCGTNSPDVIVKGRKGLKVLFVSSRKSKGGGGANCLVECLQPSTAPSPQISGIFNILNILCFWALG